MTTMELIEKHGIGANCLSDAYDLGVEQGRADRSKELADMVSSVNLDSNYLYICINRDKIKLPHFTYVSELLSWVKEQIKEQTDETL